MSAEMRKAAIVLTSIPTEEAAILLGKLTPKQVESVSIEIAKLGRLSGDEQEIAIREFGEANPNALAGTIGGLELAKELLQKAFGDKSAHSIESVQQSVESLPFGFLKRVDPQNLLTFINDEHPQTIALILSHLPPSYGAQVIHGLAPERQLAVIRRIAQMGQTNPDVIQEVEEGLANRMSAVVSQSFANAGGVAHVAEILNISDRSTERLLLENLAQDDTDLVEEIRRRMFVFEDVSKFADKDIQTILKNVETSQWAMALKGASEPLKQKVLGNMSQRAATMLREEMEYLGPARVSEVEAIQQQIVDVVRKLEESAEITRAGGGGDDQFVQ